MTTPLNRFFQSLKLLLKQLLLILCLPLFSVLTCPVTAQQMDTAQIDTTSQTETTQQTNASMVKDTKGKAEQGEKKDSSKKRIDLEKNQQALLSEELSGDSLVWLEANGDKFIALWDADSSGNPFGAVLILHGEGQTADWPNTINALRSSLSNHGWATLAISLPNPLPLKIPARPDSQANSDNTSKTLEADKTGHLKDLSRDVEKQVAARMHAAIDYLNQKGQFNIAILGHGLGATRAAVFIQQALKQKSGQTAAPNKPGAEAPRPFRALIMVSARNTIPSETIRLGKLLTNRSLPIMDIYYGDHFLDQTEAEDRLKAAKKHRLMHYHQLKILEPTDISAKGENRLTRRARGFLSKYAKGVEIDSAR